MGPLPPPPRQQTHFSLRDAVLMRARTHTHTHTHSRQTCVFPQAVSYTGQWVELDLYSHDQYHMARFGYIVYMLVMCCSDILKRIVAFFLENLGLFIFACCYCFCLLKLMFCLCFLTKIIIGLIFKSLLAIVQAMLLFLSLPFYVFIIY